MNKRIITFDGEGNILEIVDNRTVSDTKSLRISALKQECADAITNTGISWMVERELSGGTPIPQSVKDQCASYRAISNTKESEINTIAATASNENDKAVCDLIEKVTWSYQ